jgi:hypothetical protein
MNFQIPEDLGCLILRCLEKPLDARYQSIGDLIGELDKIVPGIPTSEVTASPKKTSATKEVTVKRRLRKLFLPGAPLFILVAALLLLFFLPKKGPRAVSPPQFQQMTFDGNAMRSIVSPDGKFAAYVSRPNYQSNVILVQDLANGQSLQIFRGDTIGPISWLPDGSSLSVVVKDRDLKTESLLVPRFGGNPRKLSVGPSSGISWAPDGSRFAACSSSDKTINLVNPAMGETHAFAIDADFQTIDNVKWSPAAGREGQSQYRRSEGDGSLARYRPRTGNSFHQKTSLCRTRRYHEGPRDQSKNVRPDQKPHFGLTGCWGIIKSGMGWINGLFSRIRQPYIDSLPIPGNTQPPRRRPGLS